MILKEAGQIDEEVFTNVNKIIFMMKEEYNIELTEENGAMLVTHLSIALQRIKKGEIINQLDKEIFSQVKDNKFYKISEDIVNNIENLINVLIPFNEKVYIVMHLCALLEK
ncbi:PRD domain-containing protein [Caloramator quimbayensis]|nr:PRD domain-containing protein [Caloramator quimbayensis]